MPRIAPTVRKSLYFDQDIGNYKKGEWYDNVPDDDYEFALAKGLAREVTEALDCGCRLVDGRAVAVTLLPPNLTYCQTHLADALRVPESIKKAKARAEGRVNLSEHAKKAGIV